LSSLHALHPRDFWEGMINLGRNPPVLHTSLEDEEKMEGGVENWDDYSKCSVFDCGKSSFSLPSS